MFAFLFSSRRRHTRYWRDGSSDVCSSDLDRSPCTIAQGQRLYPRDGFRKGFDLLLGVEEVRARPNVGGGLREVAQDEPPLQKRSEERRVGKECRSRWSPYH